MESSTSADDEENCFSSLLRDYSPTDFEDFCQKLLKRKEILENVSVSTTALALLSGNYFNQARQACFLPTPVTLAANELILNFSLSLLEECGSHHLPVVKLVVALCTGEENLDESDVAYLREVLKRSSFKEEAKDERGVHAVDGDQVASGERESTVTPTPPSKTDSRVEAQKLFDKMKSGRRKVPRGTVHQATDALSGSTPTRGQKQDELLESNMQKLKEVNGAHKILDCCLSHSLPILAELEKNTSTFLSVAGKGSLQTVTCRLHELHRAVEAVLGLMSLSAALGPLSPALCGSVHMLVRHCILVATTAMGAYSMLLGGKKGQTESKEDTAAAKVLDALPSTVQELLSSLKCMSTPVMSSPALCIIAMKNTISMIITRTLKVIMTTETLFREPSQNKMLCNFQSLVTHHIVSGLMPHLGANTKATASEAGKTPLGNIKFNIPLGNLVLCAVQNFISVLENLTEQEDEPTTEVTHLNVSDVSITGAYSTWQLVDMLVEQLPMLNVLFSLLFGSYKKALSLVTSSSSQDGSQTDLAAGDSFPPSKMKRTEKQEAMFRRLQQALLSSKISEAATTKESDTEKGTVGEGGSEGSHSPSSCSTVSSSGAIQGEYLVNPEDPHAEAERNQECPREREDEEREEDFEVYDDPDSEDIETTISGFLLSHHQRIQPPTGIQATPTGFPIPLAPPPPLPPKRTKLLRKMSGGVEGGDKPLRTISRDPTLIPAQTKPNFYFHLSLQVMRCLSSGMVFSNHPRLHSFLSSALSADHLSVLAWLFLNVHSLSSNSSSSSDVARLGNFEDMVTGVTEVLHEMVVGGVMSHDYHGMLLRELGLHTGCWPLFITHPLLSLLARILLCRLQAQTTPQDDPLALTIWKGLLVTLEDNAVNENEADEDLDVCHLQLLLFVWHSFSAKVRRTLLLQCANAVMHVAKERRSGTLMPPLSVCRLLLVLDYMLFQFSEPAPDLSEQVNGNLINRSDAQSSSPYLTLPLSPPLRPDAVERPQCYQSEQQLQYQRVMSKPAEPVNTGGQKCDSSGSVYPLFYNVRPSCVEEVSIDSEACQAMLKVKIDSEEIKDGYSHFCEALITLMSCGAEYRLHSDSLQTSITAACAGHQCFDLCLRMLSHLPPSHNTLIAIVDGKGLSCQNQDGSCLFLLVLIFSLKLNMQQIDLEDILDTLTETGYSTELAEKTLARVLAVDCTDHFMQQATDVLKDLCSSDDDGTMIPLMSVTTLHLLLCLLHRVVQDFTDLPPPTKESPSEKVSSVGSKKVEKPVKKEGDDGKGKKRESSTKENGKQKGDVVVESTEEDKLRHLREKLYSDHVEHFIPILLQLAMKLVQYGHLYVCQDMFLSSQRQTDAEIEVVVRKMLSISGQSFFQAKLNRHLFYVHIPEHMRERLKMWDMALLLNPTQTEKLCNRDPDEMDIIEEIVNFLDCSYTSFAGQRAFDPSRILKSTLSSLVSLLAHFFELNPEKSRELFMRATVPLATDLVTEFFTNEQSKDAIVGQVSMRKIVEICDFNTFTLQCMHHRVVECFQLAQSPAIHGHTFQGDPLEDILGLLTQLLDSSANWPVLASLEENAVPTNVASLVLLGGMSSVSSTAVTEGLKLLIRILQNSEKSHDSHLTVLCKQVSSMATMPADQLKNWLHRLVLGCVNDSSADVERHVKQLTKLTYHISKGSGSTLDSALAPAFFSTLLPLGSELVALFHKELKLVNIFHDFFRSCMNLAGIQGGDGHLVLAKAAVSWLPECANIVKTSNWKSNEDFLIPSSALVGYLAHLTSAVQLVTNEVRCTECRNLAAEDDWSVFANADGADEVSAADDDYHSDSDDESLNEKLCTFTETRREFRNQHWYHCHTCKLVDGTGCCSVCVKVCHKGHDVTYSKMGSFFCDCGAKEDASCKALVKRTPKSSPDSRTGSPMPVDGAPFSEGKHRRRRKKRKGKLKKHSEKKLESKKESPEREGEQQQRRSTSFPSSFVLQLSKQVEAYKAELLEYLANPALAGCAVELLREVLPEVVALMDSSDHCGSGPIQLSLTNLHTKEKAVEHVEDLMCTSVGCQEGALENVRINVSGDQAQTLRQLLASGAVRRSAVCCLVSSKGQKQRLVVSHDKGKLTILQLSDLLKQAESTRRKLNLFRLGQTSMPFTVLSVSSNPSSEEFMAVCGLKECQVLTVNTSGNVCDRLLLHPSVDSAGYIVKTLWVPGSQVELAIVTNTFVKIYDLSVDAISPSYYFIVCSGKIRDACVCAIDGSKFVIVTTSSGHLFCQPVIPECSASEGPVYFTIELAVNHKDIKEKDSQICEGGTSVYYSHALKLLFFSYQNGKSYMGTIDKQISSVENVFEIPLKPSSSSGSGSSNGGKPAPTSSAGSAQSLVQWGEVPQHPGLLCALTQGANNPVILLVQPEVLLIHELKSLPAKSKVQGFVIVRQPTSPGELLALNRTTLVLICEDGSLRIHQAGNSEAVLHWLQPRYQPSSPLACLALHQKRRVSAGKKKTEPPRFPIDFFEHCQRMGNSGMDFGGSDVLHIYNKEQVKHRLNVGSLFIANTKPAGFYIDVINNHSDATVMVGVRVLLGCRSTEKSPSTIEIFGRTKQVSFPSNTARWFEFPLTRDESLQADKTLRVNFGPSLDPSGVNMVDSIRIYSKTKEEFGWPQSLPPSVPASMPLTTRSRGGAPEEEDGEGSVEVVQVATSRSLGQMDKLVFNTFCILGNHCLGASSKEMTASVNVSELVKRATPLLAMSIPPILQYHARFLVACATPTSNDYHTCKDHLQISKAAHSLLSSLDDVIIDAGHYQQLLLVFLAIARTRPQDLSLIEMDIANTLKEHLQGQSSEEAVVECDLSFSSGPTHAFVDTLNKLFWTLYERRPKSPLVAAVGSAGLVAVEMTVSVLVEIMWSFVSQTPSLLGTFLNHFMKLLTSENYPIRSSCVRTFIRLLKPPQQSKQKAAPAADKENAGQEAKKEDPREPSQEPPVDGEGRGEEAPSSGDQDNERPQPQPAVVDLQEILANPHMAVEHLMAHPDLVGLVPDEEAMMNFAIALSLQEEGEGGRGESAQALHSILQGLGIPLNPAQPPVALDPEEEDEEEDEDDQELVEPKEDHEPGMEGGDAMLAESLHSSYEDLAPSREDGRGSRSQSQNQAEDQVVPQSGNGSGKHGEEEHEGGDDKREVDMCSELEMANDSSGEDDAEDSSFLEALYEHFEKPAEPSNIPADSDGGTGEDEGDGDVPNEHLLCLRLLTALSENLGQLEQVGGSRSVPCMQLLLFLCGCLKKSHRDGEAYACLLRALLTHLDIGRQDMSGVIERSPSSEVYLLILRFLNIIMSRRRMRSDESKIVAAHGLWLSTARTLRQSQCLSFCLGILKALLSSKKHLWLEESPAYPSSSGNLLRPSTMSQLVDMSPFFQHQYVKSHSNNVFETYSFLLADIVLAIPCQLKKFCEKTPNQEPLEFDSVWMDTLCEYFMATAQSSSSGKKQIRKVLVYVCGSKEKYRLVRDKYALRSYLQKIREVCQSVGFDPSGIESSIPHLPYSTLLSLVEHLKACDDIAKSRTANWQAFCQEEITVLPYLFLLAILLDESLAPTLLLLLHSALSGYYKADHDKEKDKHREKEAKKTENGEKKKEESAEKEKVVNKEKMEELSQLLSQRLLHSTDDASLVKFIQRFLMQSNHTSVRWQAHSLLHCLYKHSDPDRQVQFVQLLWQLWPEIPSCGHKASQFVDLLGYFSVSTQEVLVKENMCRELTQKAISLLKKQNLLVAAHPNAHVYSQLTSLVDFDGYYLESDPCLVCNDPEVPFTPMKLFSVKSEIRYSPNTIFVKLVGSHMFQQLILRISEIRRSKMIRTLNLYYSNRTVQNVIELKNKRSLWLKACTYTLNPSQSEVKVEFPLPITARNIIIEFADFHENVQGSAEVLQCPRCNAPVPAHPGVCATCGENVHQCHKCRAINYDERDPFLCNSCGFSKYARLDTLVEGRACTAVEPIESEDDRQKTMASINQLLEKADHVYRQLVNHRNELDRLLVALSAGATLSARSSDRSSSDSSVNRAILALAHLYCSSCKSEYQELSKIIQSVLASRRELVAYDIKKLQSGSISPHFTEPATPITPIATTPLAAPLAGATFGHCPNLSASGEDSHCYGCASATLEHCITMLKAMAFRPETRHLLVEQDLIQELMEFNLRSGTGALQKDVQRLLCQLTRDNLEATEKLNNFITKKVLEHIKSQRISPNLAAAVQPEINLLTASVGMEDSCWEHRLRTVMKIFHKARSHKSPVVMTAVTMPCIKIIQSLIVPIPTDKGKEQGKEVGVSSVLPSGIVLTRASAWMKADPSMNFERWKEAMRKNVDSSSLEAAKHKESPAVSDTLLRQALWLKRMIFNPSSRATRKTACGMIHSLCKGEERQKQVLDLLSGFLDEVSGAGEAAQEFLELFCALTEDEKGKWKLYLAQKSVLLQIGNLIGKEIDYLRQLEEATLTLDLAQGYALKMLTALLQSFLKVEQIKSQYKGQLVGMVLKGYLSLKRLVVQRTKRIDESQELLLQMLENLTSGTEKERLEFMAVCVQTLDSLHKSDMVTPTFVFEQLCSIIRPEEEDVGDFFLSLEKDPQQEEFLQGRMQGNPYRSKDTGLGPLMRDVKNKICTDCELVALLEDDTGMELLVCNKIISLDLPVKEVYKKIWCAQPNHDDRMRVVYRMRGLLGDATEDMVDQLDSGKGENVDEEEVYKMARVLSECGGLEAILSRLNHARDFIRCHELVSAALKLLGYCVKLKVNRQYLNQSHLNTLNILLGTLNMALHYEQQKSDGLGAAVAQQVLSVTEAILQEASSQRTVVAETISEEASEASEEVMKLQMLLSHIESPFVQSNLGVREGLMHIIPFLTFGDPRNMTVLLDHFAPYLNFTKFDKEHTPENALYLYCFCVVANKIGNDASGEKLKDLAIEMNITPSATEYIKAKVPPSSVTLDSPEWKEYVSQHSLPYVLKMLNGLCRNHSKTQLMVCNIVPQIHLLEQVSTSEHIGTLAENLLETMRENPVCEAAIKESRRMTQEARKRKAMALRAKELQALGMQVNERGQVIAKTSAFKELESEIVEETGLKCCICLEGYRNQPKKILGVYTYTKKATLDEFDSKGRKSVGYSTVSHFNVIHYECHSAAIKLARGRDEWESAMLQNANTRCNGILPIWGPEVTDSTFASSLARHNAYLRECTGLYDPSFRSYLHDLRLLLLRFAHEKSFSAESGGGGPQSNLYLLPYMMHVALYVLDTTRVYQREEKALNNMLTASRDKWFQLSYELEGPLHATVLTLFVQSLAQWEESRLTLLRQLIFLAHVRNASSTPIKQLPSVEIAAYSVYKPVLIFFGLVDGLHRFLKKSLSATGSDLPLALLEFIRNKDATVLEGCDKLLLKYQDELLPVESFGEFCDVMGLLGVIKDPLAFLSELLSQ